jgi:urease accessory protein
MIQRPSRAQRTAVRAAAALVLGTLAVGAQAHTGHGTESFSMGLAHPLGADHLLAMLAVGLWSVFALPAGKAWMGPVSFLLALVVSAALGAHGIVVPGLEHAIAASVVVFGLMLVLATRRLPVAAGLGLIALGASLHGLAHGAEAPLTGNFAGYAAGFLLATAALHLGGVSVGLALRRWSAAQAPRLLAGLGLLFSGAGVYLFAQL